MRTTEWKMDQIYQSYHYQILRYILAKLSSHPEAYDV